MSRRLAENPVCTKLTQAQVGRIERNEWYHSIELPNGEIIQGVIPLEALKRRFEALGVPSDLSGKRILDVGAATGWCSFELERRGGDVTAVDCVENEDFLTAHRLLRSNVEYKIMDVDELNEERLGQFDYVFFLGVLYHLRHPLMALERLCALTKEIAYVESYVCDAYLSSDERAAAPKYMEFYEVDELGGQIDNWVGPTTNCLLAFCRSAGFVRVQFLYHQEARAGVVCYRRWDVPQLNDAPAPWLSAVVNNRSNQPHFHPLKDEYVNVYFRSTEVSLAKEDVFIEIDGYAAPMLTLTHLRGESWQVNLRVPPGLSLGPHYLKLRTARSGFSDTQEFILTDSFDTAITEERVQAAPAVAPQLTAVENTALGAPVFHGYRTEYICCHFTFPTDSFSVAKQDVSLRIGERVVPIHFITQRGNEWQVIGRPPAELADGTHSVSVQTGPSTSSNSLTFEMCREQKID